MYVVCQYDQDQVEPLGRTLKSPGVVPAHATHPGRYTVAVKVIDIFGNDIMTLVPATVVTCP